MRKASTVAATDPHIEVPRLHRVLKLWDLIYYGMITVGPIAPVTVYGVALILSGGHAIITLLSRHDWGGAYCSQLRADGSRLSLGGIRLHLRRTHPESSPGISGRFSHAA